MTGVPGTLRETLRPSVLTLLEEAFAPPVAARASGRYEVELEMEGEGTFTLCVDDGELSASKGFAEDDPFISCHLSAGTWPLVQRWLQNAVDGFPAAPYLRRNQTALRSLGQADQQRLVQGIEKLDDVSLEINLTGCGTIRIARGAMDEVTRQLTLQVPETVVDELLQGAGGDAFQKVRVGGHRGLSTELMAALAPVMRVLR